MNTLQKSLLIVISACSVVGTTLPMENTQKSTTSTVGKKEAIKKILLKTLKSLAQDLDHHKDLCKNYPSDSYDGDSPSSILDKMTLLLRKAKEGDITFTDEDLQPIQFTRKTHVWEKKSKYENTKNFWPVHCAIGTINKNLLHKLSQHDITCNKKKGKRKITPCEQLLKELKRSNDRSLSNLENRSNFENRIDMLFCLANFSNFTENADELNNHDSNSDSDWTENFATSYRKPGVESSDSDSESEQPNSDTNPQDQPKLEEKDGQ